MGSLPNKVKTIPMIRLKSPAFRYNEVLRLINTPNFNSEEDIPDTFTENQRSLVEVHERKGNLDIFTPSWQAHLIYTIPTSCSILRGLLISGEYPSIVARISGLNVLVVEAFKELFFDTEVFMNKLLTVAYIRSLESDDEASLFNKRMLSWGYYLGSKYIAWKIGNPSEGISDKTPSEAVSDVLRDASWRSKEHFLSELTDNQTKEARAWVPQVLKSAEVLTSLETTNGMENSFAELKIKLGGIDTTKTLEDLGDSIKS